MYLFFFDSSIFKTSMQPGNGAIQLNNRKTFLKPHTGFRYAAMNINYGNPAALFSSTRLSSCARAPLKVYNYPELP